MNKNMRVVYKKLEDNFKKKGYIDFNHRFVNTDDDLIEISSIFRDLRYETFRIFYIKNSQIAGYESLTTRTPNQVVLYENKKGKGNAERYFEKVKNRMERLNADSYFLIHNHPSGNPVFSKYDIQTTIKYMNNVQGFKGHFTIGDSSYSAYTINKYGLSEIKNNLPLNQKLIKKMDNKLKKKSIFDIKVSSRSNFITLVATVQSSKDFSTAILTAGNGQVRMILDIPNRMINMKKEELKGYFKNLARMNGVTRVLFATKDNEVFKKGMEHLKYGTFKDLICYKDKEEKDKIYVYQKNDFLDSPDLFDVKRDVILEEEKEYEYTSNDTSYLVNGFDKDFFKNITEEMSKINKNQLRVLYKKVGMPPEIKVIEDTLEAKQELVNGLIEVVPYEDALIICNEEGKLINMPANVVFDYDYIAGNMLLVGDDYKNSGFKSLEKDEIEKLMKKLSPISLRYIKNKNGEREI